jgi:IS5 family transposase
MKMDGRLGWNPLKGVLGDALHDVLCGAGHNIQLLAERLRLLWADSEFSSTDWVNFRLHLL